MLCLSLVATSVSAAPGIATLTKPPDIGIGALVIGDNTGNSAGSVEADTAGWTLTVADAGTLAAGSMVATQAVTATGVGSTTTIVDTGLTQANDFWNGWSIVCVTGHASNVGQMVAVLDFNSSTDTLTTAAFPAATAEGDTFTLYKALAAALELCTTGGGTFGDIVAYETALQGLGGYGGVGTFSIPLYIKQTVANTDPPGAYSITLTYTTTPGE